MRHQVSGRKLNRTTSHRIAMLRNMATSLFRHERITTTVQKAKELRPFAEKLITMAKKETLHARRQVLRQIHDKEIVKKLFETIGVRFATRPGGYTRIIKTVFRKGDNAEMAIIELVGSEETIKPKKKTAAKKAAPKKAVATEAPATEETAPEEAEAVETAAEETEAVEAVAAETEKAEAASDEKEPAEATADEAKTAEIKEEKAEAAPEQKEEPTKETKAEAKEKTEDKPEEKQAAAEEKAEDAPAEKAKEEKPEPEDKK